MNRQLTKSTSMTLIYRVIISLIVALIFASIDISNFQSSGVQIRFDLMSFIIFSFATLITALITSFIVNNSTAQDSSTSSAAKSNNHSGRSGKSLGSGDREQGVVKWFNYSKGFGFITQDSGDDVFVHYRSIRGSGRRSLREGQRVEFTVSEGDKGLQADDVESLAS